MVDSNRTPDAVPEQVQKGTGKKKKATSKAKSSQSANGKGSKAKDTTKKKKRAKQLTPTERFLGQIRDQLTTAGLDTSQPLRIQMGREVVFKGTLDAPEVDKLTESRIQILESALTMTPQGEGAQGQSPASAKGAINIDLGGDRLFRYNGKGQVEVNRVPDPKAAIRNAAKQAVAYSAQVDALAQEVFGQHGEQLSDLLITHPYPSRDREAGDKAKTFTASVLEEGKAASLAAEFSDIGITEEDVFATVAWKMQGMVEQEFQTIDLQKEVGRSLDQGISPGRGARKLTNIGLDPIRLQAEILEVYTESRETRSGQLVGIGDLSQKIGYNSGILYLGLMELEAAGILAVNKEIDGDDVFISASVVDGLDVREARATLSNPALANPAVQAEPTQTQKPEIDIQKLLEVAKTGEVVWNDERSSGPVLIEEEIRRIAIPGSHLVIRLESVQSNVFGGELLQVQNGMGEVFLQYGFGDYEDSLENAAVNQLNPKETELVTAFIEAQPTRTAKPIVVEAIAPEVREVIETVDAQAAIERLEGYKRDIAEKVDSIKSALDGLAAEIEQGQQPALRGDDGKILSEFRFWTMEELLDTYAVTGDRDSLVPSACDTLTTAIQRKSGDYDFDITSLDDSRRDLTVAEFVQSELGADLSQFAEPGYMPLYPLEYRERFKAEQSTLRQQQQELSDLIPPVGRDPELDALQAEIDQANATYLAQFTDLRIGQVIAAYDILQSYGAINEDTLKQELRLVPDQMDMDLIDRENLYQLNNQVSGLTVSDIVDIHAILDLENFDLTPRTADEKKQTVTEFAGLERQVSQEELAEFFLAPFREWSVEDFVDLHHTTTRQNIQPKDPEAHRKLTEEIQSAYDELSGLYEERDGEPFEVDALLPYREMSVAELVLQDFERDLNKVNLGDYQPLSASNFQRAYGTAMGYSYEEHEGQEPPEIDTEGDPALTLAQFQDWTLKDLIEVHDTARTQSVSDAYDLLMLEDVEFSQLNMTVAEFAMEEFEIDVESVNLGGYELLEPDEYIKTFEQQEAEIAQEERSEPDEYVELLQEEPTVNGLQSEAIKEDDQIFLYDYRDWTVQDVIDVYDTTESIGVGAAYDTLTIAYRESHGLDKLSFSLEDVPQAQLILSVKDFVKEEFSTDLSSIDPAKVASRLSLSPSEYVDSVNETRQFDDLSDKLLEVFQQDQTVQRLMEGEQTPETQKAVETYILNVLQSQGSFTRPEVLETASKELTFDLMQSQNEKAAEVEQQQPFWATPEANAEREARVAALRGEGALAVVEPVQIEPTAPTANHSSPLANQLTSIKEKAVAKATELASEAKDKLPAMAIAMIELHEELKDPAREWLSQQFQTVADSGIGQELKVRGAEAVRDGLQQLKQLPAATRNRALTDSVIALTREMGQVEDGQFTYRAEAYTVKMIGTKNYSVEDASGQEVLAFKQVNPLKTIVTKNEMDLSQQFDIVRAGGVLTREKAAQAVQHVAGQAQKIATHLGNLAPEGTKEKLQEFKHQQVAAIAGVLLQSRAAVETAAGKVFEGERYQFVKNAATGALRMFAKDGRGEVMRQDGSTIESKLTDQDLDTIGKAGQKIAKAQAQAKQTEAKQTETGR